ncbi:heme-binding domain-containing protein [Aquimarina sediminis]|uniref:heme-binding domain-containing protein n=1 Tax=Aquimarina sediminis TaxID=2070536 RepID=UPI000CA0300B|nr:heme-binding domain-containing protein [Aquimarina sediminis]
MKTKGLIICSLIFGVAIQFIRPYKQEYSQPTSNDLLIANNPSVEVEYLIRVTCYDCHSNETKNYWYSDIAPIAWFLDKNVSNGKTKLNFSNWEKYTFEQRVDVAAETMFQVYEGRMPVKEYLWMHKDANLTKKQQNKITKWINSLVK